MAEFLNATAHLTGNCPNPANAVGSSDGVWAGPTSNNSDWDSRWAVANPTDPLTDSATQTIRVLARKTNHPTNPSLTVELWEAGVLVAGLASATVSSTSGQTVTGTFNSSQVSNPDDVEIRLVAAHGGGNPGNRASVQVDSIEWEADTSVSVSNGAASGTIGWVGSATGITVHSGNVSGSVGWAGTVDGTAPGITIPEGTATGSVGWTGTTTGSTTRAGDASGSVLWAGSVAGGTIHQGSTTGTLGWSGSTTGTAVHEGSTVGVVSWVGSVQGTAPTVGGQEGSATGTISWTGTTTGAISHEGSATGVLEWAGIVDGTTTYLGSATGMIGWAGEATSIIQPPPRHRLEAHPFGYGWEG